MAPRRVVFLIHPGFLSVDLTGPLEVFTIASRLRPDGAPPYEIVVAAETKGPVRTSSGLEIHAPEALAKLRGPLHTVLVVGGEAAGVKAAIERGAIPSALKRLARHARRVGSVCSGAFFLAYAGLLDGRRATTHWDACERLARFFPSVRVDRDTIYARDGNVWTSAGATAGIDLALAMVAEDLGVEVARRTAQRLVVFLQRPGGQSQFSTHVAHPEPEAGSMGELRAWIAAHLASDLTVPALAKRAGKSVRSFARTFRSEVGVTPAAYVESARVEAARALLETSAKPVERIAETCGFGAVETMRRAFARTLGVSPSSYRGRFRVRAA